MLLARHRAAARLLRRALQPRSGAGRDGSPRRSRGPVRSGRAARARRGQGTSRVALDRGPKRPCGPPGWPQRHAGKAVARRLAHDHPFPAVPSRVFPGRVPASWLRAPHPDRARAGRRPVPQALGRPVERDADPRTARHPGPRADRAHARRRGNRKVVTAWTRRRGATSTARSLRAARAAPARRRSTDCGAAARSRPACTVRSRRACRRRRIGRGSS